MKNNKQPKVSVIIATRNRAHLLLRSIKSVLDQTYGNLEIIVVDDGSTDDTQRVVRGIDDDRIRYYRNSERRGAAASRNIGIRLAAGKYIAFQDDDDEWMPEKLRVQIDILEAISSRVGMVYSDMWFFSQGKCRYHHSPRFMPSDGIVYKNALAYGVRFIGLQTVVFRKECFDRTGLFDENLGRYIDLELFIRLSKHFLFYHINRPLANYYSIPNSISTNLAKRIEARHHIMNKYSSDLVRDMKLLAKHFVLIGGDCCDNGSIKAGVQYLLRAIYYSNFKLSYVAYSVLRLVIHLVEIFVGKTKTDHIKRLLAPTYYKSTYFNNWLL